MFAGVRKAVVVILFAGAVLLGSAVAASADLGDLVNCTQYPDHPSCIVVVDAPGSPGGGSSGGGASSKCHNPAGEEIPCWRDGAWAGSDGCYYSQEHPPGDVIKQMGGQPEGDGAWYMRMCYASSGDYEVAVGGWVWFPGPPLITPQILAQRAVDSLQLPTPWIRLSPAESAPQVTFVPTWLWLDPLVWEPRSATASAGGMSVTATGVPVSVTWSTGDGGQVVCGPGTAWVSGTDPAAPSPDCGHTYNAASRDAPGGRFTVTATITWQVTWAGAGASGTEPALTSTASVPVLVVESSALTTNG